MYLGTRQVAGGSALLALLDLLSHPAQPALRAHLAVDLRLDALGLGFRPRASLHVVTHFSRLEYGSTAYGERKRQLAEIASEKQRAVFACFCSAGASHVSGRGGSFPGCGSAIRFSGTRSERQRPTLPCSKDQPVVTAVPVCEKACACPREIAQADRFRGWPWVDALPVPVRRDSGGSGSDGRHADATHDVGVRGGAGDESRSDADG